MKQPCRNCLLSHLLKIRSKTAHYNFYFHFSFPSQSVWIVLTSFASQGLLNWVQNWRHLPAPVFYYMAHSPWRKFLSVCLGPRSSERIRPSVYMLASGINKYPGCWHCVQTAHRHIRCRQKCTQDEDSIQITSGSSQRLVYTH